MPDPDHWGEGVEDALLAEVEREARARGLATIQTWTLHRPEHAGPTPRAADRLRDRSPREDRQTRVPARERVHPRAGRAQQRVRPDRRLRRSSSGCWPRPMATAGTDYRVVTWTAPDARRVPGRVRLRDLAHVDRCADRRHGRRGAALGCRARRAPRRPAAAQGGHTVSVACVEHVPTGTIAAYNELVDRRGSHRRRRSSTAPSCSRSTAATGSARS